MNLAQQQATLPATLAGNLIVYVICPLLVLSIVSMVTWARGLSRSMNTQDKALAQLIQEVTPPNAPSLSQLLTQTRLDVARMEGRAGAPTTTVVPIVPGAPHE